MTISVLPCRASSISRSRISMRACGSSPLTGSSRISTFGIVQQRAGEADALLHAVAEAFDEPVLHVGGAGQFHDFVDPCRLRSRLGMPNAAPKKSRYSRTRMLSYEPNLSGM